MTYSRPIKSLGHVGECRRDLLDLTLDWMRGMRLMSAIPERQLGAGQVRLPSQTGPNGRTICAR